MKNVKEVKITIEGKEWESALDKAFEKKKKEVKVDGFRKGSVPKAVYLKKVGIESLFMDASDIAIEQAYKKALDESDVTPVVEPGVSIDAIDKDKASFTFTFISRPEIKLGKYKDLGIKKEKIKVTKEEIENEMEHIRSHMAEVVVKENGEVVNGNTAVIDFVGTINGKEFEGGKGEDYPLEIGSNSFIPGFEEQMIGMKVGETKDLHLKFPDDYTKELKGKDVVFKVTVKELKEKVLPEYNKDFFDDLDIKGVDSKETFEKNVKEGLEKTKEENAENKYMNELLKTATDNMKVEINPEIIDSEIERMIDEYSRELKQQGMTFEQYLQFTGTKMDDVKAMMRPQAEARVKTRYLLEEVVKEEKIESTDKEVDAEVKKLAKDYEIKEEEFLQYAGGKDMIRYDLNMRKALDVIKEANK